MNATPVLPHSYVRSYPTHADSPVIPYASYQEILTTEYATDVHTTQYSHPEQPRRLSTEAISHFPIHMTRVVFDVDGPNHTCPQKWWEIETHKLHYLFSRNQPNGFAARGAGGYKIYYRLPEPIVLAQSDDAKRWTRLYEDWCDELKRMQVILADKSCADWTRLFRVPHATRNGLLLQMETIGNPDPGPWDTGHRLTDYEIKPVTYTSLHGYTGNGLLFDLFQARGWVVKELRPGCWAVKCPWESEHSKPETKFDGSTVLLAPAEGKPGGTYGFFVCHHSACVRKRRLRDFF